MGIEFCGTTAGRIDMKEGFTEEVACEKDLDGSVGVYEVKKG